MDTAQHTDLIEYLGERFEAVDRRFSEIEERFQMQFDQVHANFSSLQSSVDHYVMRGERTTDEQTVMAHQLDRHERWIQKLATKTGTKLSLEH